MILQPQVKVYAAGLTSFGGTGLRRLSLTIGGQVRELLLHEGARTVTAFALASQSRGDAAGGHAPLTLMAEWGEPLGQISELHTDADTGEILAYGLLLRGRSGALRVDAADTSWSGGELLCRKRQAYHLRDLQRGKKTRVRAQAA